MPTHAGHSRCSRWRIRVSRPNGMTQKDHGQAPCAGVPRSKALMNDCELQRAESFGHSGVALSSTSTQSPRVLVTGAAGFIGSHLCEALIASGHDVVGL